MAVGVKLQVPAPALTVAVPKRVPLTVSYTAMTSPTASAPVKVPLSVGLASSLSPLLAMTPVTTPKSSVTLTNVACACGTSATACKPTRVLSMLPSSGVLAKAASTRDKLAVVTPVTPKSVSWATVSAAGAVGAMPAAMFMTIFAASAKACTSATVLTSATDLRSITSANKLT